jgi:hypothetical protein
VSDWRDFGAAVGAAVVVYDLGDLLKALVVPRPQDRSLVVSFVRLCRNGLHVIAGRIRSFPRRDRFLSVSEGVLLLSRLALWLAIGLFGFTLLVWGLSGVTISHAFVDAASSIFTLGIAFQPGTGQSVVTILAAAFGLIAIALQIAYLPALYGAFNRRETLVTMLESRAGNPPWGPELLARHYLVGIEGNLPAFYRDWEQWAADVAESHTTYPTLLFMRSPHAANSWVVGLVAVLDSAAMYLSLCPRQAPKEARLCLRMGFTALRDIARNMKIPFEADPMPDAPITLSREEFAEGAERLTRAGMTLESTVDEAWPHFVGWRTNYEQIAYVLAERVFAPPALWTGRGGRRGVPLAPVRPVDRRPGAPQGGPAQRP